MDSGSFSTGEHICTGGPPEPQELKWQRKTTLDICSHLPCESPLLVSLSFTQHGCEGKARGGIFWFWLTVVAVLLAVLSKQWLWSSQGMVTILVTFCGLLIYFPSCGISSVLHFLERGSNPVKKQQHWLCATFMALLCATLLYKYPGKHRAVPSSEITFSYVTNSFYEALTLLKVHFVSGLEIAAAF